jgi:hypothetical protein
MKAAVVIAYINIPSAIKWLLGASLKIFMLCTNFILEIYLKNTTKSINYFQSIIKF